MISGNPNYKLGVLFKESKNDTQITLHAVALPFILCDHLVPFPLEATFIAADNRVVVGERRELLKLYGIIF